MRLITTTPGQARVPEQLPAVPPVDRRYAPPGKRRLAGSMVWVLILAGAIAGTMWASSTPPQHDCPTVPQVNQCTLQKVYLAQGTKVVAGAAGGLLVALLMEGMAGAVAPPKRRPVAPPAQPQPKAAPPTWGEIPSVKARRPQRVLREPVLARPALDLGSLPPALRDAVIAPPTLDREIR